MAMIPESSVLGDSNHDRISPDDIMLKKTELEQRDSREYKKFRRHFRIPYEILELVQLAKHRKWFSLTPRDVAWRQCLSVGQSKLLLILLKMRCVWFGFEMTPSTDRTPYCTVLQ